jgi:hypothetical protein
VPVNASTSTSSSATAANASESAAADPARALASSVAELIAQNPFLSAVIDNVELHAQAPNAADPHTASIPIPSAGAGSAAFDPSALLATLLPQVFQKVNAAKAAPATPAPTPATDTKAATTATATASAAPKVDEKAEVTASAGPAVPDLSSLALPVAQPVPVPASPASAEVEVLKAMGYSSYGDAALQQLLAAGEAKKENGDSAVQWVVEQILTGQAAKYL